MERVRCLRREHGVVGFEPRKRGRAQAWQIGELRPAIELERREPPRRVVPLCIGLRLAHARAHVRDQPPDVDRRSVGGRELEIGIDPDLQERLDQCVGMRLDRFAVARGGEAVADRAAILAEPAFGERRRDPHRATAIARFVVLSEREQAVRERPRVLGIAGRCTKRCFELLEPAPCGGLRSVRCRRRRCRRRGRSRRRCPLCAL
jgi:hypothetical protein